MVIDVLLMQCELQSLQSDAVCKIFNDKLIAEERYQKFLDDIVVRLLAILEQVTPLVIEAQNVTKLQNLFKYYHDFTPFTYEMAQHHFLTVKSGNPLYPITMDLLAKFYVSLCDRESPDVTTSLQLKAFACYTEIKSNEENTHHARLIYSDLLMLFAGVVLTSDSYLISKDAIRKKWPYQCLQIDLRIYMIKRQLQLPIHSQVSKILERIVERKKKELSDGNNFTMSDVIVKAFGRDSLLILISELQEELSNVFNYPMLFALEARGEAGEWPTMNDLL